MSVGNSRAAYMREYKERKLLEEDNCTNVPKRTKLNAEQQREYKENKRPQAGNTKPSRKLL
jgi:hypothetical protein